MKKIIVIGHQGHVDDAITLDKIAEYFAEFRGRPDIARRLWEGEHDIYDMTTHPERGDAFDHIDDNTELVVALHLYGIDLDCFDIEVVEFIHSKCKSNYSKDILYYGRNGEIHRRCLELKIPLVCSGDQPWAGVEKKTQINENGIWLYEVNNTEGFGG